VNFQTLEKRSNKNQFEKRYPELNRYILYIGGFEARKNIEGALSAFALIKDEFPDVSFVIGGKIRQGDPSYEGLLRFISKIDIADRVRFVGFVDNRYLGWFYSNALFHVFISFAEGFGLPPLEAMACGTPVLASNVSSIPEVVGDAALCVAPYDIDKIAAAMRALISDEELRSELVKKGLERCRLFSWENTARKFTNILLSQVK
jgi:glycosyltransferase involved in cell wall biosynthesis